MKILFLTHRVPYPPNRGDKLRSFNIVNYLSKEHSISLLSLADNVTDLDYENELRKYCSSVDIVVTSVFWAKIRSLFCLFSNLPLTLAYFYSKKMNKLVKEKVQSEKFDLIFIYSSSMAQYVLDIKTMPKIMDFVDVDSDKWRQYAECSGFFKRIIYKLEHKRLRKYEKAITDSVEHCIVTSNVEAELFKSFIPDIRVSVVSNGVDFGYFRPKARDDEENRMVFTGQMDYFANVDGMLYFFKEILPLIKRNISDAKLCIVGNRPAKDIVRLRSGNVDVTGFVEDIRPYIRKSAVCIVPLRIARGIQNKILEAMAMGIPVVASSQAVKGIEVEIGRDLFVEDNPDRFALKVVELLKNKELRKQIGANGRKAVEEKYDWQKNLREIGDIAESVCNRTKPAEESVVYAQS